MWSEFMTFWVYLYVSGKKSVAVNFTWQPWPWLNNLHKKGCKIGCSHLLTHLTPTWLRTVILGSIMAVSWGLSGSRCKSGRVGTVATQRRLQFGVGRGGKPLLGCIPLRVIQFDIKPLQALFCQQGIPIWQWCLFAGRNNLWHLTPVLEKGVAILYPRMCRTCF